MGLFGELQGALTAGNFATLPLALLGGVVAALNPCCLTLYPAAACACCPTPSRPVERPLGNAVAFVLGLSLAVGILGTLAVYLGRVAMISVPLRYAVAALPIIFGLSRLGWLQLPQLVPSYATNPGVGGAFGTGFLFSLVMGPCATPILASVLSYAAFTHNLGYGALLLFLFGIGMGLPIMAVGTAAGGILSRIAEGRFGRWLDLIIGCSLIALGLYLLWRA